MQCIFFTEQSYTDQCFCRLCNQFLPKTLRFSLQRHKSSRIRLTPNSWMVCRFPAFASGNSCFISSPVQKLKNSAKQNSWRVCRFSPWNLARCFRIWLGAFGKAGFFRCQSAPVPLSLFCATALCKSYKKRSFLRLFAGFFMEESCRGFFASNWLCSKPGRSLCERIKLTFATAPGCLHSLSLGRHDCFGRLCNQFLPKTLRFSLQRHKTQEFCKAEFLDSTPVSALLCFFRQWNRRAASGFGLGLLVSQGFLGAKAPLDPLCHAFLI